jgi:hypothetical protein
MSEWIERAAKAMCERAGTDWSDASEDAYAPALISKPFWRQQARVVFSDLRDAFARANNSSYDLAADALDDELNT